MRDSKHRQQTVSHQSTDEDAPLWRKDKAELKDTIRWERLPIPTIYICGYLDGSIRYTLHTSHGSVEATYWPFRSLDQRDRIGLFKTVELAKAACVAHHKNRKIK